MSYPYLITSDQHCHAWSQFSKAGPDGMNSRLKIILDEMERAYRTLISKGGNTAFMAGDLFHVRGKIEPSVFNPTFSRISHLHDRHDVYTCAIPGNHDLEGKEASEIGNAMQQLSQIDKFTVDTKIQYHHPGVVVVPWYQDLNDLRDHLRHQAAAFAANDTLDKTDVIIHAPVNGVIKGIPDHGLEAQELADLGFRRVFAGHYHDHKEFCGGKVVSVGATTHQTWSDVGTTAGFLLVYEDHIEHYESLAPKFIDLNVTPNASVKGNYVRVKLEDVTEKEIQAIRYELGSDGALGVTMNITKKTTTGIRTGATAKAGTSLAASVEHYVRNDMKPMLADEVSKLAQQVLAEAQA